MGFFGRENGLGIGFGFGLDGYASGVLTTMANGLMGGD